MSSYELGEQRAWDFFEWAESEHPEFVPGDMAGFVQGVLATARQLLDDLQVGTDDFEDWLEDLADHEALPV